MKELAIGDNMFHPCNLDIIEHKITSIRQFDGFKHYVMKAVHNVGACGRVEVIVDEHKGKFKFVELVNEENMKYSSGLQDFIEGNYYRTFNEAKLEFYQQQVTLARSNMEEKRRLFNEAENRHKQVKTIVETLKKELKQ